MNIESINKKLQLPQAVVERLIDAKLLRQPSEITDSAEGALILPEFETLDEFEELIKRIGEVSDEVAAELEQELVRMREHGSNGNGSNGTKRDESG